MPSSSSSNFHRPLLIYDDKCTSCIKFAKIATKLSRNWILTAGHYNSDKVQDVRKKVFPENYDPTKMFWLINKKGAYGGREGLIPLIKEIFIGAFNKGGGINNDDFKIACDYQELQTCNSSINTMKRVFNLLKKGHRFSFQNY